MSTLAPGTPGWVDLASSDVEAAKQFYGELFGWSPATVESPDAGGYTIFYLDGKQAAGVGPVMGADQPVAWTTYVLTDNADTTAAKVEAAGGKILAPPMDVVDYGRMAVFGDQSGAAFAVWQPGKMGGGEVFNTPGALTWNELTTRDPEGSKTFYRSVFGWEPKDSPFGPVTYTTWKLDDRPVGGMMPMAGEMWPAEIPPHWMVYFAVADCDASAAKATELGATVAVPPTDIPPGRFSVITDPQGAVFSIITPKDTTA